MMTMFEYAKYLEEMGIQINREEFNPRFEELLNFIKTNKSFKALTNERNKTNSKTKKIN